eukprot:8043584-Alexandrium_andersonii.AAC.1
MVQRCAQAQDDFNLSIVRDADISPGDYHACVINEMGADVSLRPPAGFYVINASGPPPLELDT